MNETCILVTSPDELFKRALCALRMCVIAPIVLGAGIAYSQNYPDKPIRIVTAAAGGGADYSARLIAQALTASVGQQVIIDNRNLVIGPEIVVKAPPDGYTLLLMGSPLWIEPLLRETMRYNVVKDFSPISRVSKAPNILVVNPSLPVKSVRQLIALAKAKPSELNYASANMGSASHLSAELFKAMAGVNIVRVAFKATGAAIIDVMRGELEMMFATASAVSPHVKSGRVRALAVTSAEASALFPGMPTIAASGLPGYEFEATYAIFAPAKTPAGVISRLSEEIVRFLHTAEAKEKLSRVGTEVVGSSPEQLAATIKSEMVRFGKVIKDAGIRGE